MSETNGAFLSGPGADASDGGATGPGGVGATSTGAPGADGAPADDWTSPMAALPGAVLGFAAADGEEARVGGADSPTGTDAPARPRDLRRVPLHYSDPSGEQRALEAGRALVDRTDLGIVTVTGPDRQTWLTSITSQVITGMGPGDSRELLVLDPQGHIEHAAAVSDDGRATWLITEGFDAAPLAAFLDSMRFALRVEVAVRTDVAVLGSAGPRGAAFDAPECLFTWEDPWPGPCEGGAEYFRGAHPGADLRMRLHVIARDAVGGVVERWMNAGQRRRPAGLLAWEAMRIAAWRPRLGFETDARAIPAELDWLRTAVHTNKGCYRGQESIARVINLGRPPRRLVHLQLDGSRGDLPEPGAKVEVRGRVMGVLTSVARHEEQGPIGLALVARALPADLVLDFDGIAAAQELIVPVDGKSSLSPQTRPGADLVNPELRRPDARGVGGLSGSGARR